MDTVFPDVWCSHGKDTTVMRPSCLNSIIAYTGETASLWWDGPQTVNHIALVLTRCGLVTSHDVRDLGYQCSWRWLVTVSAPSHRVNQWWCNCQCNPRNILYSKQNILSGEKKTTQKILPQNTSQFAQVLTHWSRVTHICVGNLLFNGSDNGLSPGRRQAIIWTNAGVLFIGPLGTKFSEI